MLEFVLIVLIFLIAALLLFIYNIKFKEDSSQTNNLIKFSESLANQIQEVRKEIDKNSKDSREDIENRLNQINKQMNDFTKSSASNMSNQYKESNKVIKEVTSELEKIKNTNEQVLGFSNQLKNLEKTFSNVKQRGLFGEIQLENLLSDYAPAGTYEMQYSFNNGDTVDAIINSGEYIIPIDAKFPMENYNRLLESSNTEEEAEYANKFKNDVKKRIDETSKYVRPKEGTIDLAYMFVPAEGLYQDMLRSRTGTININDINLIKYAFNKNVIICSPVTLFAMLTVVLKQIQNYKVEESIKNVFKNVEKLSSHLNAYKVYHEKLGNQLGITVGHYNTSSKEFKKIDKDVIKITSGNSKIEIESEIVEKPIIEN